MLKYQLIGLQNYLSDKYFDLFRKNKNFEERYSGYILSKSDEITEQVSRKVLDKLTDIMSEDVVNKLLNQSDKNL